MALVQAAVDVLELKKGKAVADMAVCKGADIIEVGTGLLFKYGFDAIKEIRKTVGDRARIIADYKYAAGMGLVGYVKDAGADMILLTAGYKDFLVEATVNESLKDEITPVFDLFINHKDIEKRVPQLVSIGADHLFIHHYEPLWDAGGAYGTIDSLSEIRKLNLDVKVDVTSDDFSEARDAVEKGADIITFGVVLKDLNEEECERWIRMIHQS